MKLKLFFILPFVLSSFITLAAPSKNILQLGIYTSSITYTEPLVMQEEGSLFGFTGSLTHEKNNAFRVIEVYYGSGYMDYEGSGTIEDIPNVIYEIRGLFGNKIGNIADYKVSPYIGLGYRYLNDDSSDMVSSTNLGGYEREQTYTYAPIGVEFKKENKINGWTLSTRIEYDYFIEGANTSHLSDVNSTLYDDVSFTQNEGYGHRISLTFTKKFRSGREITIEPFYRYWNISDSTRDYNSKNGQYYYEPYNDSEEFGVSLLFRM